MLDNACGTAAVTDEILKRFPSAKIHAVEGSVGMIDVAKSTIEQKGWTGRVETGVMDGQKLTFGKEMFDISVTNFGIFFFPDPEAGAREIWRTLKRGGRAVVTCWKEPGLVPLLHDCQKSIRPKTSIESLPVLEKWMKKETIEQVMKQGGFQDVLIESFDSMFGGKDEKEMAHLQGAVEMLLRGKGSSLFVEKHGKRGVPMVAWIATCKKYRGTVVGPCDSG